MNQSHFLTRMSIPPLVCCTPPPTDQCEHDIDPDVYENTYASANENGEQYNYDDFCDYEDYQVRNTLPNVSAKQDKIDSFISNIQSTPPPTPISMNVASPATQKNDKIKQQEGEIKVENFEDKLKPKLDEENSIEDLGLRLNSSDLKSNELLSLENSDEFKKDASETVDDDRESNRSHQDFSKSDKIEVDDSDQQKDQIDERQTQDNLDSLVNHNDNSSEKLNTEKEYNKILDEEISDFQFVASDMNLEAEVFSKFPFKSIAYQENIDNDCERLSIDYNTTVPSNNELQYGEITSNSHSTITPNLNHFDHNDVPNHINSSDSQISNEINANDLNFDSFIPNTAVENSLKIGISLDLNEHVNKISSKECKEVGSDITTINETFNKIGFNEVKSIEILESQVIHENCNKGDLEFDDFEVFQTPMERDNGLTSNIDSILQSNNPWEQSSSDGFGDFKANFDDLPPQMSKHEKSDHTVVDATSEEDDDFGDFDDFQTCNKEAKSNLSIINPIENLDLSSSEGDHIPESITRVISSVFEKALVETEEIAVSSLESYLSATWKCLNEIELRQPYMLQWNNSLGQKTLLKSLCIDSRNILFGPKWSNMPKYAFNLGASPLVPASASSNSEGNERNSSTSVSESIPEPSNDGPEFSYAEALLLDLEHLMATLDQMAHNQSSLKISELLSHAHCESTQESTAKLSLVLPEHPFSSPEPLHPEKVYAPVPPFRQINLPDTHIFTPTDSEVPQSKTISNDFKATDQAETSLFADKNTFQRSTNTVNSDCMNTESSPKEDDFTDFQDFKATNTSVFALETESKPQVLSPVLATQGILQPVKIEPIIPTVNWPDPGDVKETFDDFSDFISSCSWARTEGDDASKDATFTNTPNQGEFPISNQSDESNLNSMSTKEKNVFSSKDTSVTNSCDPAESPECSVKSANDDFDDFQFSTQIQGNVSKNDVQFKTVYATNNAALPNMSTILTPSSVSPAASLKQTTETIGPQSEKPVQKSPQNSTQILQPLSLESFSQINWPSPGMDLQDLSRFNPINSVHTLQAESSNKLASPAHSIKSQNQMSDDDGWGDFVSSKPLPHSTQNINSFTDDGDDWSDFVCSPNVRPPNGLNTISLNISAQRNSPNRRPESAKSDLPSLSYVIPKQSTHNTNTERHLNL